MRGEDIGEQTASGETVQFRDEQTVISVLISQTGKYLMKIFCVNLIVMIMVCTVSLYSLVVTSLLLAQSHSQMVVTVQCPDKAEKAGQL